MSAATSSTHLGILSYLVSAATSSAHLGILQKFSVDFDGDSYFLNKTGRLQLPKILKERILQDELSEARQKSSSQKIHEFTKPASCLGVYSSKGPIKEVVPSKKRYFDSSNVKKSLHNTNEKTQHKM